SASTSSGSAKLRQTSAKSASPSRTRTKVCDTPVRESVARLERLVSDDGGIAVPTQAHGAKECRSCPAADSGTQKSLWCDPASATGSDSVRTAYLRSGHRRHSGTYACLRFHDGRGAPSGERG